MTDEPNYQTRAMLQDKLDAEKARNDALEARLAKLEAAPPTISSAQEIISALREDRQSERSAALQRELDEAYRQIDHLKRPQTPSGPGIPYSGWAQAKEDLWDGHLVRQGPKEGKPGEVFQIELPDYWPGCPFTPVIVTGQREDGSYIVKPHPDFQSH